MASSILTIILFFIYTWGLGFTATYWLKKPDHRGERFFLNVGLGLGLFAFLIVLLNLFRIPLDWKIFLALSLIFPLFRLYKLYTLKPWHFHLPKFNFKLTRTNLAFIIVLLIFAVSLFVYTKGAFSYPYLEDEDPWGHSTGVKYVAMEKDAYDPVVNVYRETSDPVISYIDPYPPAYDAMLGILHQTSPDITWTLKFFNALIISLGLIFFYIFVKRFSGDQNKAVFAAFILAVIPSYLSHFIWAMALATTLFFPAVYALNEIKDDKRWFWMALVLIAAIWFAQNISQPLKLIFLLLIMVLVWSLSLAKLQWRPLIAIIGGTALSFIWWVPMIFKRGLQNFISYYTIGDQAEIITGAGSGAGEAVGSSLWIKLSTLWSVISNPGGSSARAYNLNDFFIAKGQNLINAPIGIGIFVSLLVLIGIILVLLKYKSTLTDPKQAWLAIAVLWLIYGFWAVNGSTFPFSIARDSFRSWMLLAIPVAMMAAEGYYWVKNRFNSKTLKLAWFLFIFLGVMLTSAQQKYELNTAIWPTSGSFTNPQEPFEYAEFFKSIPFDTKVFVYSPRDKLPLGLGAFSCLWCQEVIDFRENILYSDVNQLYSFLKSQGYEYLIINGAMDYKYLSSKFGANETNELLPQRYDEIFNSGKFTPVVQQPDRYVILRVD